MLERIQFPVEVQSSNKRSTLLFETLGRKKLKVTNAAMGITIMKERLLCKRVLVVLDDVNNLIQLNNLAGGLDWFGMGSRIIVTTRDKGLLVSHGIDLMYYVKGLDYHEANELFSWYAFKRREPLDEYVELTEHAVGYAQGLPLALRVLGSCLYGRDVDTWKATLDGFKSTEIQEILRISYDALEYSAKEVFLDIACFFKGGHRKHVMEVLDGCGLNTNHCVNVLINMALINIDESDCIRMHDLLEEMGKEIVYQESPNDPGKHSRLWFHDDVYDVLTENTGTSTITGIKVELPETLSEICLSHPSFSNMSNLRLFIHRTGCFSGVLDCLPSSLRVVDWPQCPFQSLPSSFNARKLAVLNMRRSCITGFGKGFKLLKNLGSINLSFCKFLTKVSDLSGMPNLKNLNLSYCTSLLEVHSSVGFLDKLEKLTVDSCSRLEIFPRSVIWGSLGRLSLYGCEKLKSFIEIVNKMESTEYLNLGRSGIKELPSCIRCLTSLKRLDLSETQITELPSSIGYLLRLQSLYLSGCKSLTSLPDSMCGLQQLEVLNLSRCPKLVIFPDKECFNVSISESLPLVCPTSSNTSHGYCGSFLLFPRLIALMFEVCNWSESVYNFLASLDCFTTLLTLNLSGSNLVSLPVFISRFVRLRYLKLRGCKILREILEVPPNVEEIDVGNCISLERLPVVSKILEVYDTGLLNLLDLSNCRRLLIDNMGFDAVSKTDAVELNEVVSKMGAALVLNQVEKKSEFSVILPGSEVPECLDWQKVDVSVLKGDNTADDICEFLIEIPRTMKWEQTGLVVCAVFNAAQDYSGHCGFGLDITVNEVDMDDDSSHSCSFRETTEEHVWLTYIPLNVDLKHELDTKSDLLIPYSCRINFFYINGKGSLCTSCGVHLANVPGNDIDADEDDVSNEGLAKEGYSKSSVSNSGMGLAGEFVDTAEAATVSKTASLSVLSGGISTKRGIEHCDLGGEPCPTKRLKNLIEQNKDVRN